MMIPSRGAKEFIASDSVCGYWLHALSNWQMMIRYVVTVEASCRKWDARRGWNVIRNMHDYGLTETASLQSMSKNPHVRTGRRMLAWIRKTFSLHVPAESIMLIINWWRKSSGDLLLMLFLTRQRRPSSYEFASLPKIFDIFMPLKCE